MDPITLIVTALATGAAQGAVDSAAQVVQDSYQGLKRLVAKRFAGNKGAEVALAEHAGDPQTWTAPLAKALADSGASTDQAIIEAAKQLMALLDEAGTRAGKYTVDLRAAQGVQVGDHNQQVNQFGQAAPGN